MVVSSAAEQPPDPNKADHYGYPDAVSSSVITAVVTHARRICLHTRPPESDGAAGLFVILIVA